MSKRRPGKVHPLRSVELSKGRAKMLPARGSAPLKHPLRTHSEVRHISASEYNETGRGQRVFDACVHKIGQFADIAPMSKESKAYKLATQR